MDSITQGVLGAAIGEAILGKKIGNKGAVVGAIVASIPDFDVVFYLYYSKLEMLSIHRGFSHSIVFSVIGALLVALALSKMKWFHGIRFKVLFYFAWLCLFTHMLLDTFTAYGTQLLLPFDNKRLGFDSINVVDPLYTIPLILGLVLSLWFYKTKSDKTKYNRWGLMISSAYLIFSLFHKEVVNSQIASKLSSAKIDYNALLTIPVGVANVNWYAVAKGNDSIYMLKYSLFSDESNIDAFPINEKYLSQIDPAVAEKMRWFAKGFYTVEKSNEKIRVYNLQVDMRGVVNSEGKKYPTIGYFEMSSKGTSTTFSSGSIKK